MESNSSENEEMDIYEAGEEPKLIFNKTSVLVTSSHDDSEGKSECSYCHGKRTTFEGNEEGLKYYTSAFTSTKLRADDYEKLLESGYTRCGTYIYIRNVQKSCCESYQYKVEVD
jgi:hypothetical protein